MALDNGLLRLFKPGQGMSLVYVSTDICQTVTAVNQVEAEQSMKLTSTIVAAGHHKSTKLPHDQTEQAIAANLHLTGISGHSLSSTDDTPETRGKEKEQCKRRLHARSQDLHCKTPAPNHSPAPHEALMVHSQQQHPMALPEAPPRPPWQGDRMKAMAKVRHCHSMLPGTAQPNSMR